MILPTRALAPLALALALHALLAGLAWLILPPQPSPGEPEGSLQEIEVRLLMAEHTLRAAPGRAEPAPAPSIARRTPREAVRWAARDEGLVEASPEQVAKGAEAAPSLAVQRPVPARAAQPRRHPVDLGLSGGVLSQGVLEHWQVRARREQQRSVGGLREGLQALDALSPAGRASPARAALARAALAGGAALPGSAQFEVTAGQDGRVLSVVLLSFEGSPQKWHQVRHRTLSYLRGRRIGLPRGASGYRLRLHVHRGPAPRHTPRRPALGQMPRRPRDVGDNASTRAHLEAPQASPTLGVLRMDTGGSGGLRVDIVSQQVL